MRRFVLTQTASIRPATPTSLTATSVAPSSVLLLWTDNATTETGYYVERSSDGINYSIIATLTANSVTYTDGPLPEGVTYYYRVRAYLNTMYSSYSNVATVTTLVLMDILLSLFATPANEEASLQRLDGQADPLSRYFFRNRLYNNLVGAVSFDAPVTNQIGDAGVRMAQKAIQYITQLRSVATSPDIDFDGAGWIHSISPNYGSYSQDMGGRWSYNNAAGCSFSYTTEALTTHIWLLQLKSISVGCAAIVEIDGSRTAANALPTAQELIDSGTLANSILVANGGAFAPTDRVLEYYSQNANSEILIASNLTPGVHTITVTQTGHRHASSAGNNIYLAALAIGRTDLRFDDTNLYFIDHQYVWDMTTLGYPVDEFAYSITPTGTNGGEWIGHVNSTTLLTVPTFTNDGVAITPANRTIYRGTQFVMSYSMNTYHSEVVPSIGTLAVTLTFNELTWLSIDHTYTLAVGGSVTGYGAMMTTAELLNKCSYLGASQDYDLDNGDNSLQGSHQTGDFYSWDEDGYVGSIIYMSNLADVDNWATSVSDLYYLDHGSGTYNKAYYERFIATAFNSGAVWRSRVNQRIQWFPTGADIALSNG